MKRTTILIAAGLGLTTALSSTPASATFVRTFVSGTGSDSNPCTRTQPCLTFAFAITQTTAGGEIDVLDPGGYGPVVITKAISIVNDGVGTVGVRALSGGAAITINAGAADNINLRGLTIEGAGVGQVGIQFNTGKSLAISNCVVRNFTAFGVDFVPNAASDLSISNTFLANIGGDGIKVLPSGMVTVNAVFDRVEVYNNGLTGILVQGDTSTGTINATVTDSLAANNGNHGIASTSSAGHAATSLMIVRSVTANNNGAGIASIGLGAIVRVGQSTVAGNANGWEVLTSGVVLSYGDNKINGNTANEAAPPAVPGGNK